MTGLVPTRHAGLIARLAAVGLDLLVLLGAVLAVRLIVRFGVPAWRVEWGELEHGPAIASALASVVVFGWVLAGRALGGTPGDLLMGLRLVRSRDGARPELARVAARVAIATALLGLGVLWCIGRGPRAALHDRLSGTALLVEDDAGKSLRDLELGR